MEIDIIMDRTFFVSVKYSHMPIKYYHFKSYWSTVVFELFTVGNSSI